MIRAMEWLHGIHQQPNRTTLLPNRTTLLPNRTTLLPNRTKILPRLYCHQMLKHHLRLRDSSVQQWCTKLTTLHRQLSRHVIYQWGKKEMERHLKPYTISVLLGSILVLLSVFLTIDPLTKSWQFVPEPLRPMFCIRPIGAGKDIHSHCNHWVTMDLRKHVSSACVRLV